MTQQIELTAREITPLSELPTTSTSVAVREVAEVVEAEPESLPAGSILHDPYIGVAALPFDQRAQTVLAKYQTVPDEWIDIKPNGQIYLSHTKLRWIYNEAFSYGGWGMVPVGSLAVERVPKKSKYPNSPDYEHVTVYREYRLYVQGRFVRQMMGAGDYYTNNAETNYADAVEASESYALNRSGKPFGIASQCWDKSYGEMWKKKYAVHSDGKWSKRTDTPSGAGAPTDQSYKGEIPQSVPQHEPSEQPSEAPAPSFSNQHTTIYVSEAGKAWRFGGQPIQLFTDTTSKKWKAVGAEAIATLNAAVGKPFAGVDVEWREEVDKKDDKTYKNRVIVAAKKRDE